MADRTPSAARGQVIDATARFECARDGHEPSFTMRSVFVESWICACARCGRLVEFKNREPIHVG